MTNHYKTLGLNDGASQEAIQEAYDRLYKELDPANNDNQDFFIEELEKLEEAYKVLRNSSILATERGINNSKIKPTSSSNSIKSKNESKKESNKISILQRLINEKKKISLFILVVIFLKIFIHFFIFPTEKTILNTDKKVFVQTTISDKYYIRRGQGKDDVNGNKLIVYGDNFFYYPKELKKVSIAEHINMTFAEKLWLFPCIIILLLLLFWINNKTELENNKKQNLSSYFSKQNIIIILLLSLSISSNVYLFIKINDDNSLTDNKKTVSSEDIVNTKSNNYSADEASGSAEEANSSSEDASSYAEDAYSYMIRAEEYMNNAAQSAQDAEEFANSR
ncbi:MAG: DnaJ domain-containing protein [Bacteroidia bacterium]|nr:DnaJ domain-containing protein [Bacteroidia bacterium]